MAAARTSRAKVATSEDGLSIDVKTVDGKTRKLAFKSFALMPLGIYRKNRNDEHAHMWEAFEWALSEDGLAILDEMPATSLYDTYNEMQRVSKTDTGES